MQQQQLHELVLEIERPHSFVEQAMAKVPPKPMNHLHLQHHPMQCLDFPLERQEPHLLPIETPIHLHYEPCNTLNSAVMPMQWTILLHWDHG
jgi:hypothetical protein